jgi:hypothetical protein
MDRTGSRNGRVLRWRLFLVLLAMTLVGAGLIETIPSEAQRSILRRPKESPPITISPVASGEELEEALERRVGLSQFGVDELDGRDSPPDLTPYNRPMVAADRIPRRPAAAGVAATVVDVVVNNTDPNLKTTNNSNDGETNIAVNSLNTNQIVITAFANVGWGSNSPLWQSTDGGNTWTNSLSVPAPPTSGASIGTSGCPCDQSIDYGRGGRMSGTFLTFGPTDVYTGTTTGPSSSSAWSWLTVGGTAQKTNLFGAANVDQPWLTVGHDPITPSQDNVYVAYDDFTISPRGMRVAVAGGSDPPNFLVDNLAGFGPAGTINPGHRLAVDPISGAVYSLFQQIVTTNADGSRSINYMLNRSTAGGLTWGLNSSSTGIQVANANSNQPTPKFGTVNALLGGADSAAVDPTNGDVYYVYGDRDGATTNNRLSMRRLSSNGAGGLNVGSPVFVNGQVQSAIPSIAINSVGVIGIFYYTYDGVTAGFPQFTAHFATSTNHGFSFTDTNLETFLSPATDDGDTRQRVLGDYQQVKAVGTTFYGSFTGNGVPFGRSTSNNDPIFYKVDVQMLTAAGVTIAGRVLSSSGTGVRNAVVRITDQQGSVMQATTNAFGYFRFSDVQSGQSYVVESTARGVVFDARLLAVTDAMVDLTIIGR